MVQTVPSNLPGSDVANMTLLGYDAKVQGEHQLKLLVQILK